MGDKSAPCHPGRYLSKGAVSHPLRGEVPQVTDGIIIPDEVLAGVDFRPDSSEWTVRFSTGLESAIDLPFATQSIDKRIREWLRRI